MRSAVSAFDDVWEELREARHKHPTPLRSPHEGFAVLAQEVHELWEDAGPEARP